MIRRLALVALCLASYGCAEDRTGGRSQGATDEPDGPSLESAGDGGFSATPSDDGAYEDGYDDSEEDPDGDEVEYDFERERAEQARRDVEWAQQDLDRSVRNLQTGDWENELPTVQRRLRQLDYATQDLHSADPEGSGASNLQYEVDRMQRDMRRLESEDWRQVVPDIDRGNRNIGYETDNIADPYGFE